MKLRFLQAIIFLSALLLSVQSKATDYYWIGGAGSWNDGAHWSLTSGGAAASAVPTASDNVIFDDNSGVSDFTVSIDDPYDVFNITMQQSTAEILFDNTHFSADFLNVYGSTITLNERTKFEDIYFMTASGNSTDISFNGADMSQDIFFDGEGTYTILTDLTCGATLEFNSGSLYFDDVNVTANSFRIYGDTGDELVLGASSFYVTFTFTFSGRNDFVFDAGTSTIETDDRIGNFFFDQYDYAPQYHTMIINAEMLAQSVGQAEIQTLIFNEGSDVTLQGDPGETLTVNGALILEGSIDNLVKLRSYTSGQQVGFTMETGAVLSAEWLEMTDIVIIGDQTYDAPNSVDGGNNSGWNITAPVEHDYYWVGGSGQWSDAQNHWATTSGGDTFHSIAPTKFDKVIFDQNSGTGDLCITTDQESIKVGDFDSENFTDELVLYSTYTFSSSNSKPNLFVNGSVVFNPIFKTNFGNFYFEGAGTETVDLNGFDAGDIRLYFQGIGDYAMMSDISADYFSLNNTDELGTVSTNGFDMDVNFLNVNYKGGVFDMSDSYVSCRYVSAYDGDFFTDNEFSTLEVYSTADVVGRMNFDDPVVNHLVINGKVDVLNVDAMTFSTLEIKPGSEFHFDNYADRAITFDNLIADGSLGAISIGADVELSFINTSGIVTVDEVILENINASGGATFIANNSLDNGGNTGWVFNGTLTGSDYYWVGGSGDWNEYDTHWATSSGGTTFHTHPPSFIDNVIFDFYSFTEDNSVVTVSSGVQCADLNILQISNTMTLEGVNGGKLFPKGSLNFDPRATIDVDMKFESPTAETITADGATFGENVWEMWHLDGSLEFIGHINAPSLSIDHQRGTVTLNGVELRTDIVLKEYYTYNSSTLNLGNADIVVENFLLSWYTSHTFDKGNATVEVTNRFDTRQVQSLDQVTFKGDVTIESDVDVWSFRIGHGTTITFEAGSTITFNNMVPSSNPVGIITFKSSEPGSTYTFSKASGSVNIDWLDISDNVATGGATFNATNCYDRGNVTGWNITPIVGQDYYWVGNGSWWSDLSHWATTSGGSTKHTRLPSRYDNVYFDANSFDADNQLIWFASYDAEVANLDMSGIDQTMRFSQGSGFVTKVWESATFSDLTTFVTFTELHFEDANHYDPNGATFMNPYSIHIENSDGNTITIMDELILDELNISGGGVDFGGNDITATSVSITEMTSDVDLSNAIIQVSESFVLETEGMIIGDGSTIELPEGGTFGGSGEGKLGEVVFSNAVLVEAAIGMNTLTLVGGADLEISYEADLTFDELVADGGSQADPVTIRRTEDHLLPSTLTSDADEVLLKWGQLYGIAAEGAADFTALATIDLGKNSGWTFTKINPELTFDPLTTKVYGDDAFGLAISAKDGVDVSVGLSNADVLSLDGNTATILSGGVVDITASVSETPFYQAGQVIRSLTVDKAVLDVTAENKSKTYGDENPELTLIFEGFVNSDDESDLPNPPVATTSATAESEVGYYDITPTGGSDSRYNFNIILGGLDIVKADQTITFDQPEDQSIFDGTSTVSAISSTGLPVYFSIADPGIATVSGNTLTLVALGSTTITASQPGSANYNAAPDVIRDLTVAEIYKWNGNEWNSGSAPTTPVDIQLEGDMEVSGIIETSSIYVAPGVTLTIEEGGVLKDNGSVTNDGQVVVASGGSIVVMGDASGSNYQIQRNTTGNAGYSIIGAMVSDKTVADFAFDYAYTYDGTDFVLPALTDPMLPGKGFFAGYNEANPMLMFDGELNTGNQSYSLPSADTYHLVANPYAAPIDHLSLVAGNTSFDGTIYLWDDGGTNMSDVRGGGYVTVNSDGLAVGGNGLQGPSAFNGKIGSGQGFFIYADAATSIDFTPTMQSDLAGVNGDENFYRKANVIPMIKMDLQQGSLNDQLMITFKEEATKAFDRGLDARKLMNMGLSFYSMIGDDPFAIQSLPLQFETLEIPLGYLTNTEGEVVLNLERNNLPDAWQVDLVDHETETVYAVSDSSSLTFSIQNTDLDGRLSLRLTNKVLDVSETGDKLLVYAEAAAVQVYHPTLEGAQEVTIHSLEGKIVHHSQVLFQNHLVEVPTVLQHNAVYVLTVGGESIKFLLNP